MTETIEQAQPIDGDGIQNNVETPNGQAPQPTETEKLLQAEMTRNRQALIDATAEIVSHNASKLHTITDDKLKDSVCRKQYGMSYNEAVAVFGNNFVPKKADDAGTTDDIVEEQNKKIRLLEYKQEQADIENAIASHKAANPGMWTEGSLTVDQLKEELANVSTALPIDERIKRAANISIGSIFDTKSLAYSLLNKGKINGATVPSKSGTKTEVESKSEAMSDYLMKQMGRKAK